MEPNSSVIYVQLQEKANYNDDDDFNDNYHYSNNYFDYDGEKNDQKHTIFCWSNELFFC